jgi:YHS domain-containing protein
MIRFLFLRVLPLLLLYWLLRSVIRAILAAAHSSVTPRTAQPSPRVQTGGELKKDPVCGTFVAADASVTKRVNGEVLHFCSTTCRDKYRVA